MHIIGLPHPAAQVDVARLLPEQHPPLHGCWSSQAVPHCMLWQALPVAHWS